MVLQHIFRGIRSIKSRLNINGKKNLTKDTAVNFKSTTSVTSENIQTKRRLYDDLKLSHNVYFQVRGETAKRYSHELHLTGNHEFESWVI